MDIFDRYPHHLGPGVALGELLGLSVLKMSEILSAAFRIERKPGNAKTLLPGPETPLWNQLRRQVRPYLATHGTQAKLGRLLGLPRQRVNEYFTRGTAMPDAERTLQLMLWLAEKQVGRDPS